LQNIKNKNIKLCDIGRGIGTIVFFSEKIGYTSFGIEINKKLKPIDKILDNTKRRCHSCIFYA